MGIMEEKAVQSNVPTDNTNEINAVEIGLIFSTVVAFSLNHLH